jgi:hypothetical protein
MSLLGRIIQFPRREHRPAGTPDLAPSSPGDAQRVPRGGRYRVEIVGEASYQPAIARLAGPKTRDGVSVYRAALLVPEPDNPHDPNAVAVRIEGLPVGYLSREQAVAFHRALGGDDGRAAAPVGPVKAWLHGGWRRPGDEGHYSVTLFLADPLLGEALGSDDRA